MSQLIAEFPRFLDAFGRDPPFNRHGQLEYHLATIQRRRALGSAVNAIEDGLFLQSLYRTLQAWGIGARASKLEPFEAFAGTLRAKSSQIAVLDGLSIDDPTLNPSAVGEQLWCLIDGLHIVTNNTRIVPGSKALHHLLPDLVVPMDRAYTQRFFHWQNPKFQYEPASCFQQAFAAFVEIARKVNPAQYMGVGWNSSRTKIIDNAVVGMLRDEEESGELTKQGWQRTEAFVVGVTTEIAIAGGRARSLYAVLMDTPEQAVEAVRRIVAPGCEVEFTGSKLLPETVRKLGLKPGQAHHF